MSKSKFDTYKALIEQALGIHLPKADTRPAVLHEAMQYSVFSGGKRLRPILCLAACEAVGGSVKNALVPASAIEFLHTYTLIHDDLPAMDDDDLRRGKPTCHVKFGEANAILAGDALLTLAFELISPYPKLSKELAQAAGSQGIIAGQVEDLSPHENDLEYIHLNKTAKLFRAAVRIGALAGGGAKQELEALSEYGEKLGLAFQIVDDVQDEKQDNRLNAAGVWGKNEAVARARKLLAQAKKSLQKVSGDSTVLASIADLVHG